MRIEDRLRRQALTSQRPIGFLGFRFTAERGVRLTKAEAKKIATLISVVRTVASGDAGNCGHSEGCAIYDPLARGDCDCGFYVVEDALEWLDEESQP